MGPLDLPVGVDRSVDVRPHPHIDLSTVTYLFAGESMHRDSLGSAQALRPPGGGQLDDRRPRATLSGGGRSCINIVATNEPTGYAIDTGDTSGDKTRCE